MSPMVKKLIAAAGVAKVIDAVNDRRKPKRSTLSRVAPGGLFAAVAAAGFLYFLKFRGSNQTLPAGDTGSPAQGATASGTNPAEVGT